MEKKKPRLPKSFEPRIISFEELLAEAEERVRKKTKEIPEFYKIIGEPTRRRKEDEPQEKFPLFEIISRNSDINTKIYSNSSKEEPLIMLNSYISNLSEVLKKDYISLNDTKIKEIQNSYIEKNLEEFIKPYYNLSNIIKTPFSKKGLGLGLYLNTPLIGEPTVSITAENVGEYVLPIVQYIAETKPDYVIASDRGARLIGLAVKMLYQRLYGRLPTVDGTLRFRRFSTSNGQAHTEQHLKPFVDEMLRHKRKPKVLLLDDWVCSGSTQTLAENVFSNLSNGKVNLKFGVLLRGRADISGEGGYTSNFGGTVDWHDRAEIIGVNYSGTRATPVKSYESAKYRQRMQRSINKLARKVLSREKTREPTAEPEPQLASAY